MVTSLTKLFSGKGDVIAGSVILNSHSKFHAPLTAFMAQHYTSTLYCSDALVMLDNCQDFEERSAQINRTSEELFEWLLLQEGVTQVHYPKSSSRAVYDEFRRPGAEAGYGGLMSIILGEGFCPKAFYDALPSLKGPSLGTNFTLCSPYTLLVRPIRPRPCPYPCPYPCP